MRLAGAIAGAVRALPGGVLAAWIGTETGACRISRATVGQKCVFPRNCGAPRMLPSPIFCGMTVKTLTRPKSLVL